MFGRFACVVATDRQSLPITVSCNIILLSLSFCLSIWHAAHNKYATQMRFIIGNLILIRYVLFENTNCILMNSNFHFNFLTFAWTIQQIENEMGNVCVLPPQLVCAVDGQTLSVRVHTLGCWALSQTFSNVLINYTSEMYERISRYGIFVKAFFFVSSPQEIPFLLLNWKRSGKIPQKWKMIHLYSTIINHSYDL